MQKHHHLRQPVSNHLVHYNDKIEDHLSTMVLKITLHLNKEIHFLFSSSTLSHFKTLQTV